VPIWSVAENLAPPGFGPRTVQPVSVPTALSRPMLNNSKYDKMQYNLLICFFVVLLYDTKILLKHGHATHKASDPFTWHKVCATVRQITRSLLLTNPNVLNPVHRCL
jgi:hypothetical protein